MNNKTRLFLFFLSLFIFSLEIHAQQESTRPLQFNSILNKQYKKTSKLKSVKAGPDTANLNLPFIDDFSRPGVYPDSRLWSDSFVYINTAFPLNPISIGVATFDALDQRGILYSNASNSPVEADHLTSRHINLQTSAGDSLYLSFFYQPRGLGAYLDRNDSLVLDFLSPIDSIWRTVWRSLADSAWFIKPDSTPPFKLGMVPITDTAYLHRGFRFRFRNFASVKTDVHSGKDGNGDIWNLDYVYLDRHRNYYDTIFPDVAITEPIKSLLKNYESMPWKHFILPSAYVKEWGGTANLPFRNNSTEEASVTYRFTILDSVSKTPLYQDLSGSKEVLARQVTTFTEDRFSAFLTESQDSGIFKVTATIEVVNTDLLDFIKANDTAIYYQTFLNYYSYDDGSPELGYGFTGEGIENGQLAYKFISAKNDTLQAIAIYFNPSIKYTNTPDDNFLLTVWNDKNGSPGSIIYSKGERPKSYGNFSYYSIDSLFVVPDTFYVGWRQLNTRFLNVGLDMNRVNKKKIYYNLGNGWQASSQKGCLMIRPVMGSREDLGPLMSLKREKAYQINLYPNPSNGIIHIVLPENLSTFKKTINIFDITGKAVLTRFGSEIQYDISMLNPGVYLIRITFDNGTLFQTKLVKF